MNPSYGDTVLLMTPIVGLLIAFILRLDDNLFAPVPGKKPGRFKPRFSNYQDGDDMILADPDGRVTRFERK